MPSETDWILIRGLFDSDTGTSARRGSFRSRRATEFGEQVGILGVKTYERVDGRGRKMANRLLRRLRGTAPPPDAVEIMSFAREDLCEALAGDAGRECWQKFAGCQQDDFDESRSFVLMGPALRLLEEQGSRQKILWFGNGLENLGQARFIEHYTNRHGPLVKSHASLIGLRSYLQVPSEDCGLCEDLRELGLGRAHPPAVFAQLVMGSPSLKLSGLRARRAATREIEADEKRHIDFARSMLLLAS